MAPTCMICKRGIRLLDQVSSGRNKFHKKCFRCSACETRLAYGGLFSRELSPHILGPELRCVACTTTAAERADAVAPAPVAEEQKKETTKKTTKETAMELEKCRQDLAAWLTAASTHAGQKFESPDALTMGPHGVICAPVHKDEARRLELLKSYHVVATGPEPEFVRIAGLVADMMGCQVVLIKFVDDNMSTFKACYIRKDSENLRGALEVVGGLPARFGVCAWDLLVTEPYWVEDMSADARFERCCKAGIPFRFIASAPIVPQGDLTIGSICCLNSAPMQPPPHSLEKMARYAKFVVQLLELRKRTAMVQSALDDVVAYTGVSDKALAGEPEEPTSTMSSGTTRWVIQYPELRLKEKLGFGSFGVVFRAQWRKADVVIKQSVDASTEIVSALIREGEYLMDVRPHPNILLFLGICINPKFPLCLVTEFVDGGSLADLLTDKTRHITVRAALRILLDVAAGMEHLHTENICHADLAARNVLLVNKGDHDWAAKVADFGLSHNMVARNLGLKLVDASISMPIRWTAPEVLVAGTDTSFKQPADIWSFGVVIYEVFARDTNPYRGMSNAEVVRFVGELDQRLSRPTELTMPDAVFELMNSCWLRIPEDRPTFDQLGQSLEQILQTFKESDLPELAKGSKAKESADPKILSKSGSSGRYQQTKYESGFLLQPGVRAVTSGTEDTYGKESEVFVIDDKMSAQPVRDDIYGASPAQLSPQQPGTPANGEAVYGVSPSSLSVSAGV